MLGGQAVRFACACMCAPSTTCTGMTVSACRGLRSCVTLSPDMYVFTWGSIYAWLCKDVRDFLCGVQLRVGPCGHFNVCIVQDVSVPFGLLCTSVSALDLSWSAFDGSAKIRVHFSSMHLPLWCHLGSCAICCSVQSAVTLLSSP